MSERNRFIPQVSRHRLFIGLAAGLGLSIAAVQAAPLQHAVPRSGGATPETGNTLAARFGNKPEHPFGTPHHVTSCTDDPTPGSGSLRSIVADPATVSGDSIDFTQLPMMCSNITLGGQAIKIDQDSLYLQGPGAQNLTIDANGASAVFYHSGVGTLYISDLTITNGSFTSPVAPLGGCIYSAGSVFLTDTVVDHCSIASSDGNKAALGGGVYVAKDLTLVRSTISNNVAMTTAGAHTYGGGAYVRGSLFSLDSTISDNTATAPGSTATMGGGVLVYGDVVSIENSTISGNKATTAGGLMLMNTLTGSILNSTVSGNSARYYGGVLSNGDLMVTNSTIAFNTSTLSTEASGLYTRNATLTLQNSIIADNVSGGEASDLGGAPGTQVNGANNLVVSSALMVSGTVGVCPHLDVLADNGGGTRTHGLRPDSAAIDSGDAGNSTADQRGVSRPQGAAADIGAVERESTDKVERLLASGFDGLCDQ